MTWIYPGIDSTDSLAILPIITLYRFPAIGA